jgi:hypothetical protein
MYEEILNESTTACSLRKGVKKSNVDVITGPLSQKVVGAEVTGSGVGDSVKPSTISTLAIQTALMRKSRSMSRRILDFKAVQ